MSDKHFLSLRDRGGVTTQPVFMILWKIYENLLFLNFIKEEKIHGNFTVTRGLSLRNLNRCDIRKLNLVM